MLRRVLRKIAEADPLYNSRDEITPGLFGLAHKTIDCSRERIDVAARRVAPTRAKVQERTAVSSTPAQEAHAAAGRFERIQIDMNFLAKRLRWRSFGPAFRLSVSGRAKRRLDLRMTSAFAFLVFIIFVSAMSAGRGGAKD